VADALTIFVVLGLGEPRPNVEQHLITATTT